MGQSSAYKSLTQATAEELLSRLKSCSPSFFESVVVKLRSLVLEQDRVRVGSGRDSPVFELPQGIGILAAGIQRENPLPET
jgi:hypothetical protein